MSVLNEGQVAGSHVVQLYISLPEIGLATPLLQLRGFKKVTSIQAGFSVSVTLFLDKYAFSFWDEVDNQWVLPSGIHTLHIGSSSADLPLRSTVEFPHPMTWRGL